MKKIGIISKPGRPEPEEILKELLPRLRLKGHEAYVDAEAAGRLNIEGYTRAEIVSRADVVIVLGGDGTMLSVSRLVAEKGIPILGINLGTMGFITEINQNELYDAVDAMLSDSCVVEERLMLCARIVREGETI